MRSEENGEHTFRDLIHHLLSCSLAHIVHYNIRSPRREKQRVTMDDITASVLAAVPRDAQSMVDVRLAETSSCAGDDDGVALERELGHDGGINRMCGVTGDSSGSA